MKIAEVSQQCNISPDTLRYYERIGLLPPISRTPNGIRDYSELDLKRVEFIKCMRNAGLPIELLIEYYRLVEQGTETMATRKAILEEQRERLLTKRDELQNTLDLLAYKITVYEQLIWHKENEVFPTVE